MFSFIHISDLHIGKKLHGYDLLQDQRYIFRQIVSAAEDMRPDAVFIAGDVYDKSSPSEEAVAALDEFLAALHKTGAEIFIIPGNHDPAEKLSYLSAIVDPHGVHISKPYSGVMEKRRIKDVDIYMLPYLNFSAGKRFFPDKEISSLDDLVRETIEASGLEDGRTNILLAHQFVTGAAAAGSEKIIGGEPSVSASVFYPFSYVALGHIHRAQSLGFSAIRYSGSPLKYSVSEREAKVLLYGRVSDDGEVDVSEVRLRPIRDVVRLRGRFDDLMAQPPVDDYVYVRLTDETDVPEALTRLASKFKYFLAMDYEGRDARSELALETALDFEEEKRPYEYFTELFTMQTGHEMRNEQKAMLEEAIEKVWGKA